MKLLERALDVIAPHDCIVCGKEGSLLCAWCEPDAFESAFSACFGCAKQTDNFAVCDKCKRSIPITNIYYSTYYEKNAKALIRALKFQQRRTAALAIAKQLDSMLPFFDKAIVVNVPTAANRVRQRGFDHSLLIARELAQLRYLSHKNVLARIGSSRQVGHTKKQRQTQLKGNIRIKRASGLQGKTVLLVDDVVTTGATMGECAAVLKAAGAKSVIGAAFALSRLQ